MKRLRVYNEERFRTPLAHERALGVWVDRIGCRQKDALKPPHFRVLGQYAAVSVEAGTGVLECTGKDVQTVGSGDVMLLCPSEPSRYYPATSWDTRWVVWNGPEAALLAQLSGLGPGSMVVRGGAGAALTTWQRLDPLMERLDFDALLGRKLALLGLIRELSALRRTEGTPPRFLQAALRELARHEGTPEPIADMAKRLHLSPAHFRRLFKVQTGTSPKAFQVSMRITKAKALLAEGRTIKQAADALGFADVFHFMRSFRAVTGQTAGQFVAVFARTGIANGASQVPAPASPQRLLRHHWTPERA